VSRVAAISLEDVDPVELPGGSWSRLLITEHTVAGNTSSLGCSVFTAGTATVGLSHAVEELAYVVSGRGAIQLEEDQLEVRAGQGLFIPARIWHTVVNQGDEDLVMVFSFPSPGYPATERRESRR
jgi:mannose-6-phosphate isomerase-like protein (cupin superfamily)